MLSTFATIAIPAAEQQAAQQYLGEGYFTSGYYKAVQEADPAVATHYVSSGFWLDSELEFIVNEAAWSKSVKFGDAQSALDVLNLKPVEQAQQSQAEQVA